MKNTPKNVMVIDMNNVAFRSLFAIIASGKKDEKKFFDPFADEEEQVDRELLLVSDLISSIIANIISWNKTFGPSGIVMCFDSGEKSWRKSMYDGYKKKNSEVERTKEEIYQRELTFYVLDVIHDFVSQKTSSLAIRYPRAEGDDCIKVITDRLQEEGKNTIIISGDTDFTQLVNDGVSLYHPIPKKLVTISGNYFKVGTKKSKKYPMDDQIELPMYNGYWALERDKKTGEHVKIDPKFELFIKCIRGDVADDIPSAYPRVRKTTITDAFYGGTEKFNNFLQTLVGSDDDKRPVNEAFERNMQLIDLTLAPVEIHEGIKEQIEQQLKRRKNRWISIDIQKFAKAYDLPDFVQSSHQLIKMFGETVIEGE